jgi:CheY-like chemotaxis protein
MRRRNPVCKYDIPKGLIEHGNGLRYTMGMARKRALVVDDSKSARVILSRMLEKYDIEVDMAEAAEQAIEYLKNNRPDAIFMDHLMPGMDGLQAVQTIKGNPQTAMIPIMMYTSQEGELYVGTGARSGSDGRAAETGAPGRRLESFVRITFIAGPARHDRAGAGAGGTWAEPAAECRSRRAPRAAAAAAPGVDWGRRVETAVKDQAVDVRRFIVASLDSFASRIVSDVRDSLPA